jgi:tetratricopeptide (TPR) repeat protein
MYYKSMAFGVMLACTGLATAQFPFGPSPGCFGLSGVRFGYHGRNLNISGYVSPAFGYRYYSPYAFAPVLPASGYMSNTIVFVQPRVQAPIRPADLLPNLPAVPPIEERDDVIVIRPKVGGVKNLPLPRDGAARKGPGDKLIDVAGLLAPRAAAGPANETARQIQLGREAFAAGEYGRAMERFERAAQLSPNDALPIFLRAAAEFALGKYTDAAATIVKGLKLRPDWPAEKFSIVELYGRNVAEAALHHEQLAQAVAANPAEPALLFLHGYHLWFRDRRVEAAGFFRQALPLTADTKPIERFL